MLTRMLKVWPGSNCNAPQKVLQLNARQGRRAPLR